MEKQDIYEKLGKHLSLLGMGYPYTEDLIEILRQNYTELDAKVALAIPTKVIPLEPVGIDEIQKGIDLPREKLKETLENLDEKGMLFSGDTTGGEKGYALHQVGFGFPQTFFWKGEETPHSREMAKLISKYFNRKVTEECLSGAETKAYRYVPVVRSIEPERQAVFPFHMMEKVIKEAKVIALAHCPCRIIYKMRGGKCDHPTEVCMKFNELARYVIAKGIAKELSKQEALEKIKETEEAGLVHFVDNAKGDIRHNCNCCGCACWNVGNISRRKIPRDVIMETYFIRETDRDRCTGCGACAEICPVRTVELKDDFPLTEEEWCIGCGVCSTVCPSDAAKMKLRPDKTGEIQANNFRELQEKILEEKGLK